MYLFKKDDNNQISILEMQSNPERIESYKRKVMEETIPFERRVLLALSSSGSKVLDQNNSDKVDFSDLFHSRGGYGRPIYHKMYRYGEKFRDEEMQIQENYFKGEYSKKETPIVKVSIEDRFEEQRKYYGNIIYLLLTQKNYKLIPPSVYTMPGIIVLSKPLYLLHLLETGRFDKLEDDDLSAQLASFDIIEAYKETISLGALKNSFDSGLISGSYDGVIKRVEESAKVLKWRSN